MEYKTYKVVRGIYGGTEESFITIPSDMTLVTGGKRDIGRFLCGGHLNYIGYVKSPYEEVTERCNGLAVTVQKFRKDDCFVLIHDIKFVDMPTNEIINPDEMKIGQYANKISKWNVDVVGIDTYENKYEYCAFWSENGKLIKMSQIKFIKSEFNIELNTVWNASDIDDNIAIRIVGQETAKLDGLCLSGGYTKIKGIMVNGHIANAYYTKLLKNVLTGVGIVTINDREVKSNDIDLDKLYNMFQNFIRANKLDGKKADALMNMTEI
jgi:hypothetical protein